ncbi:MAG TPA: TonB-dependent receptor, partial [Acidobacteriota bacterium]|nr:TonB-dependent receptor [Acidobacteriota bacterium]
MTPVHFFRAACCIVVGCVFFLLASQTSFGQQIVTGTVRYQSTQEPASGVVVQIQRQGLAMPIEAQSDSTGRFFFNRLSPGGYTITATLKDYVADAVVFTLVPRTVQQVELELRSRIAVAETVEVKAKRLLLDETQGASVEVIDPSFEDRLPAARRTNLPDLIAAFVPSAVASHDNFVHLRGNELSLNTSLNGVSFIDNPHQYFTPGLNPDVIQAFSVITGGFPAEYGNRFGGIIDAVTRSGFDSDHHGSISIDLGTYLRHTASMQWGGHTGKFGYFVAASGFESQRFINPPQPQEVHDVGKGIRTFAQFDYRATASDTFRLALINSGTNFEVPNTIEEQANGRDFFQRSREQTALLSWEHVVSPTGLLVTSLSERLVGVRLLPTTDPVSIQAGGLRNNVTVGIRSDYTQVIGTRHTLKTGFELTGWRLREDFSFDPRENEFEIPAFGFRGRQSGGQIGGYIQDRFQPIRNLVANIGVRFDVYNLLSHERQVSPRINLAYTFPSTGTVIHGAYNRFFAPPPIENLLLSANLAEDNLPPRPVKSNFYEAGVSQSFKNRLLVRLTSYYRNDVNSFETSEFANVRQFLPTAFVRGKAYGVELSLRVPEIPRLHISGYFNYTAQRAFQSEKVAGGFSDEAEGEDILAAPAFDQIHT